MPIPPRPTHVNTSRLKVFKAASCKGVVLRELQSFTPLALIRSKGGCAEVAAEGHAIGFVPHWRLQELAAPAAPQAVAPQQAREQTREPRNRHLPGAKKPDAPQNDGQRD